MSTDPQDPASTPGARTEVPHADAPSQDTHARAPQATPGANMPVPAKADVTKRIIAGVIDGVAAYVVGLVPIVGGLVATAYWLARDGLDVDFMPNRSLGKKIVGLQPVTLDGRPLDLEASIKRNLPFAIGGVATILAFIPIIGWLLLLIVVPIALIVVLVELFFIVTDEEGRRMGDKFAGTRVIETGEGML